jgi:hypothetical protein
MGRLFLLDLAGNRLSGTLPAPWARQRTLVRLSLARNTLTGGLPREWSSMRSLLQLDLAGNKLRGVLPPEWSALQQVTSVDLSSNTLGGGLPAVWGGLGSLQVLQLQGNQLTGVSVAMLAGGLDGQVAVAARPALLASAATSAHAHGPHPVLLRCRPSQTHGLHWQTVPTASAWQEMRSCVAQWLCR